MNTSQNGTASDSSGNWRPAIAPIWNGSMPVTCPATMIGMPIAPNATGAVFAIRHSPAVQRLEAEADEQRRRDRDGRAEAGRAFEECAEREADQQHLQALVVGDRQHGRANDVELAGLHDDLVQEHGRDDDPRDRPDAVREAEAGRRERLRYGHPVREDRDAEREQQRDRRGDVALEPQRGSATKKKMIGIAATNADSPRLPSGV